MKNNDATPTPSPPVIFSSRAVTVNRPCSIITGTSEGHAQEIKPKAIAAKNTTPGSRAAQADVTGHRSQTPRKKMPPTKVAVECSQTKRSPGCTAA